MSRTDVALDQLIPALLADPAHADNPLRTALAQLWQQQRDGLQRLERLTHLSDGFQSMARERELGLAQRFDKQLRQIEKIARISDRYQAMLRELNLALEQASSHDPLTQLVNRRPLIARLRAEVERSERLGHPFCVAMLDIDHFKQVNDRFGHEAGDRVLVEAARRMASELREYDLCGRWGGEEFLIVLPETQLATARQVVERVQRTVRAMQVAFGPHQLSITLSAGLAQHQPGEDYAVTVGRADAALLGAKEAGRDCYALS